MTENASPTLTRDDTGPAPPGEDPRVTEALEAHLAALEAGETPDPDELQARYPELAGVLGGYLKGLEFLHRTTARLRASTDPRPDPARLPPGGEPPPLDDYEIVREVGRGGMGIVYEARQRSLRRRVALKVLSLGATLDARHRQRFQNEAQAAAQLQHPNIVPVYAVGCERGVHYYAMRFIEGKTLRELIQELRGGPAGTPHGSGATDSERARLTSEQSGRPDSGAGPAAPPPPAPVKNGAPATADCRLPTACAEDRFRQAAWLGVQAAEALEHAHQQGVIHRDVKPANLLLDGQGQLWVADFGLARCGADLTLTLTGDVLGTLPYMSPEQASARRGLVDHRSDIYSLGATLYELVTLQPVCRGADRRELLQNVFEDPVPPRRLCRDVPRDLETILLKALGKQVEERYATAQEMADDLRRFLAGRPVLARRPTLWERAGKWARRRRAVVCSAVGLLVLCVLGLTAGTLAIGHEQAKTRAAYEQEVRARRTEAEARRNEAAARARAEQNFRQARQLLDEISEVAAVDLAADGDAPKVRLRLLQAALCYYQELLERHDYKAGTREELLRGHARVATLLEAMGRPKDAQAAWIRVVKIVLGGGGKGGGGLVPANGKLQLLKLPSVQKELGLSPQQVRAVFALESRRAERLRPGQSPPGEGRRVAEKEAEAIDREALTVLNPKQAKRLGELLLQQARVWALEDPTLRAAIRLTPEQRQKIKVIQKEALGTPPGPGKAEERSKEPSLEHIVAVFTPEQTARWRELVGEPFPGVLPPGSLVLYVGRVTFTFGGRPGPGQKKGPAAKAPPP
jgi:eukaryotic-like serine/threonine-protein kinase